MPLHQSASMSRWFTYVAEKTSILLFCTLHTAFYTYHDAGYWNRTSDSSLEETRDVTSPNRPGLPSAPYFHPITHSPLRSRHLLRQGMAHRPPGRRPLARRKTRENEANKKAPRPLRASGLSWFTRISSSPGACTLLGVSLLRKAARTQTLPLHGARLGSVAGGLVGDELHCYSCVPRQRDATLYLYRSFWGSQL